MSTAQSVLRWAARGASLVTIVLLFQFVWGEDFSTTRPREWVGLAFFPIGVVVGLAIAWWRPAIGASVAAASLLAFYLVYGLVLGGRVGGPWFLVFASPAALFFLAWAVERRRLQY